ncbi:MAG: hypothetical protein B7733_23005 [Myxococcales bacterium FL481]|nr:MAG: hypothetical protein B7733_23005 [Myxococcales bacterium FL481]
MLWWTRRELVVFAGYVLGLVAAYTLAGWSFLQLPWAPVGVLGTAVAFMVGFQNNSAYGRIWEARKIWGGIVNVSRTWGMQILDMVNDSRVEQGVAAEEVQRHRTVLVHRQIAWLTALRHAMREPRRWEEFERDGTNREWAREIHIPERIHGLEDELFDCLPDSEWDEVLQRTNKAAAILNMQSRHLTQLQQQGLIWQFAYLQLQELLREMFTLQGKSERIKNFPYPRQYATLSMFFVRLFIALVPFAAVPKFAEVGESLTPTWPGVGPHFVWCAVPFCTLISWVFHTMERIGRVGENPFEGSANDVPISTISRGIEIDLRQMLGEPPEHLPKPVPVVYDVQM